MTCPDCERMKLTNKELHRRLQKSESAFACIFKQHNPMLAQLESDALMIRDYADRLRRLYKSEWRQFQTDDPLFTVKYGQYIDGSTLFQQFKNWIIKGK